MRHTLVTLQGTNKYRYIYIYVYLEPKWFLFFKVNPPKQGLFQSKQGSFGFQVYISYIPSKDSWEDDFPFPWVGYVSSPKGIAIFRVPNNWYSGWNSEAKKSVSSLSIHNFGQYLQVDLLSQTGWRKKSWAPQKTWYYIGQAGKNA